MTSVADSIFAHGIVPVVAIRREEDALPLCAALRDGGLPLAEITFRTQAAAASIRAVRRQMPEVLAGAGTVTSIALADQAVDAGAQFIVTPGFNPEVVAHCLGLGIPVYPGCTTASEVEAARNLGLSTVKFFPAEQSGGLARIKALSGPYPDMRFMPTGGISPANLPEYLASPLIVACGGTFMVPASATDSGDWDTVRRLSREALRCALGARLIQAGPLLDDAGERNSALAALAAVSGQDPADGSGGPGIVTLREAGDSFMMRFAVTNLCRSLAYLQLQGQSVDPVSVQRDGAGRPMSARLADAPGGVVVELCRK